MDEAIAAVPENGTLELDSSTALTAPVTIDKPMTVNGNGGTVDTVNVSDADVTIDNVVTSSVSVTGTKDFALTNSTIDGGTDNISIETSGKVKLSGNTFKDGD